MHVDKALGIISRICTDDFTKEALAKIRKSMVETIKRNKELEGINDFLEEYVSGTIPD